MRLEKYSVKKLKQEILTIIGKYLDMKDCRIFFFGSRVTDKGNERSDIDIGLERDHEIPRATMAKIKEEMENLPILYKLEIVDFKTAAPEFRAVALKKIEMIN
jgi:predicted nucleotidyltransferase